MTSHGYRGTKGRSSLAMVVAIALALSPSGAWAETWPEAEAFAAGSAKIFPEGGEQDVDGGIALIRQAAEAGNPEAKYALGILYRQGGLIARDEAQARLLMEQAAAAGLAPAQGVLGEMVLEATGEYESPDEGRAWLIRAAEQGDLLAHAALGTSYLEKTPKKYDLALEHLTVAAEGGVVDAQLMLGIAYMNGGGLYASDAPRRYDLGLPWIGRAADGGSPLAWTWIGWAYEDGLGIDADPQKAAAAWHRAAEMGDAPGANALALAYRDGIGVQRNQQLYEQWSRRAAELGHLGAREAVARQEIAAARKRDTAIAVLVLLGLVAGAAGGDAGGSDQKRTRFMDPSDPMQAWGMDIMRRIR